jgi:electron transport complex protein RnfB
MPQVNLRVAVIDETTCIGCGRCITACPFDAIELNERDIAVVDNDRCRGCMRCAPPCPVNAIHRG